MLCKKIVKNIVFLIQGKVKIKEVTSKIFAYAFDNYRLIRRLRRARFPIDEIEFRGIRRGDESRYLEFMSTNFQHNLSQGAGQIAMLECSADFVYYIALYGERVVGAVGVEKVALKDGKAWRVTGFTVVGNLRGCGIGEKLLRTAISKIEHESSAIFLDVFRNNLSAINLYKKLGFLSTQQRQKFEVDNVKYPPEKLVMVLKNHKQT